MQVVSGLSMVALNAQVVVHREDQRMAKKVTAKAVT